MRAPLFALLMSAVLTAQAFAQGPVIKHSDYQLGVTPFNSYSTPEPFRLVGVVLNQTEHWLDPTEHYNDTTMFYLGGQAEIMIQAVDLDGTPNDPYQGSEQSGVNDPLYADFGGTFVWIGQNYGNLPGYTPGDNYIDEDMVGEGELRPVWYEELDRLHFWRPGSFWSENQLVRAGDLVEIQVPVSGLEYFGKHNVNERHNLADAYDYEVVILEKGYGLPDPVQLTLGDLKGSSNQFLYDATRQTGPEQYQATLVELNDVVLEGMGGGFDLSTNTTLTAIDETGRSIPVYLGLDPDLDVATLPAGPLHITGVLDQYAFNDPTRESGYRLLVTEASAIQPSPTGGDIDRDGDVDGADFLVWQRDFGSVASPAGSGADRDFSGRVDSGDLALWQATYGSGGNLPTTLAVPEPIASAAMLGVLLLAIGSRPRTA